MNRRNLLYYLSNQHNVLVKFLLFVFTAFVIVSILPEEARFQKSFELGRVWRHDTFYAPFTFAIQKSDAELTKDAEELKQNAPKYFRFDNELAAERIRNLPSEVDTLKLRYKEAEKAGMLSRLDSSLISHISRWYKQGILNNQLSRNFSENEIVERSSEGVMLKKVDAYVHKELVMDSIAYFVYGSKTWFDKELESFFLSVIIPNVQFDEQYTEYMFKDALENISKTRGLVNTGDLIIRNGEIVDSKKFQILFSLKNEYERQFGVSIYSHFLLAVGQVILVVLILILLYLFIIFLRPEIFEDSIKLTLISLLIILLLGATAFIYSSKLVNVYTIPFCVLPIIIRSFFDTRLALFAYLLTTMLISLVVPYSFEFLFIEILGGISVVFTALNLRQRSRLFLMISTLAIVYCSAFLGLHLVGGGDLSTIDVNMLLALTTSAVLTLFAFPLIYLIERIFGYTSDISLLELSDTNSPLLREMSLKAPGTFQHSLQVANLAESAIGVIGGNMLLARTGALYHDIGKIEFARYFIENQLTGVNPHNELDFDESAQLIISHVHRGIKLARKYKIPDRIIDFIRTHHGTSTVHHFYKSFLKNYPEEEVDEGAFRYPGPIPYSKETAVVMMADAVEARSRSFNTLTKEQIVSLVDDSIQRQLDDNQFVNADITLKDISKIKKVFKKILIDFHHVRIIEG